MSARHFIKIDIEIEIIAKICLLNREDSSRLAVFASYRNTVPLQPREPSPRLRPTARTVPSVASVALIKLATGQTVVL